MKKVIKLTESDLLKIVKRVISEQETQQETQPSDNNFIQQKYTEFTNLLTPSIKNAFIKQYPVQDAISELNSCRPSKFENFKEKLTILKDKLKSFVSGSDLNKDIQSVSAYLEKTPNVNEQFGEIVLGGLAMFLLTSLYKSFLSNHGYVPQTSCMGPGNHLPFYIEGTFNLLKDIFHFKVQKNIWNRKIEKWNPKKNGVKGDSQRKINRDYNRAQKQKSQQQKRELSMMNRQSKQNDKNAQKNREEYYLDLIKAFDNYVRTNVSNGVLTKNYLDIDNFDVTVNDFFNEENNYKYVDNPENREKIKNYFKVGV